MPAPTRATASAFAHWSRLNSGTTTSGVPYPRASSVVPYPPWPTTAAARGMTAACETQRSTRTFGGSVPSSAGSRSSPIARRMRARRGASASIAAR